MPLIVTLMPLFVIPFRVTRLMKFKNWTFYISFSVKNWTKQRESIYGACLYM
jgi:hypothetical protein